MTVTVGSLCTGYGGLDLAAELAIGPLDHRWHAENDPGAAAVLAHHWPHTPNLGDLTAVDFTQVEPVRILIAGYPCQGESFAGRRGGHEDERWLWPHVARSIRVVRPELVLLENVPGHLSLGFGRVLADLASIGYVGSWLCVRASDVGAPHRRERVFIAAYPADTDLDELWTQPVTESRRGPAAGPRAAGQGGDSLLPTPGARLGDGRGAPAPDLAADRVGSGRRNLDDAVALLPTPTKSDTTGPGRATVHGVNLRTAAQTLLPTPGATDTGGPRPVAEQRTHDGPDHGPRLQDVAVNLLPTPAARDHKGADRRGERPDGARRTDLQRSLPGVVGDLLPTPRATDGTKGGPNQRGSSGDLMLPSAVMDLLPTPVVTDSEGARNATANRRNPKPTTNTGSWTLGDIAHANRWGRYTDAITRWETATGRPAPDPTEPGTRGQPRLSPRFVEWMMGLPAGWVTDHVGRNPALRILGNGVVPTQGALAIAALLATRP